MNDPKLPKHIRGWFKQQYNKGVRFSKMTLPPGYDRAHFRGYESAKGYDYRYSELNLKSNHELQHKYDLNGELNKKEVSQKGNIIKGTH